MLAAAETDDIVAVGGNGGVFLPFPISDAHSSNTHVAVRYVWLRLLVLTNFHSREKRASLEKIIC